jgi:predicted dehydrogenase
MLTERSRQMKTVKAIMIGAGSRGYGAYPPYSLDYPDKIQFIAVADPRPERREAFCEAYKVDPAYAYEDYNSLLAAGLPADVAFICTQDDLHVDPAIKAMEAGYHIALEKPMATNLEDCKAIVSKSVELNRQLILCYVLRYTRFFNSIKDIIDSGEIGDVVSISLTEHVGYEHAAHSFVRGNWRNEEQSSPMILAKSSHDIDILCWLMNSDCIKISSFGNLKYFKRENAPKGSVLRCLDGCEVKESCPFDAEKIYTNPEIQGWPVDVITDDLSPEGRMKAIKETPYGRCVYHCDNDVEDHQNVILEFENGATANFAMNSLTYRCYREINVYATKGQLTGIMEDNQIVKNIFGKPTEIVSTIVPDQSAYGHGGGDKGFMEYVCKRIGENLDDPRDIPPLLSHEICFKVEQARKENRVIERGKN